MKQLHEETGIGMMYCRHILEKYSSNYEDAMAYINSDEYKKYHKREHDQERTGKK